MKKEEAQELLRKYRLGQCTKRESEIIDLWYQSLDRDKSGLSKMEDWDKLEKKILGDIDNEIDKEEKNNVQSEGRSVRKPEFFHFTNLKRIAAVFLLGIGLAFFLYQQNATIEEPVMYEIASSTASPSTVYLPDGSVVWLKGESRLEYPEGFTGDTRGVTLIGEAFFDIAKDHEKPFIIHTAHFTTSVLGTSFNIKAYQEDISQEVTVVTGKVLVSVREDTDKLREVILESNQRVIIVQKDESLAELNTVEYSDFVDLARSKLDFDEIPLGDIIKVLNGVYDTNISLGNDNMKNCVITADLTNETLEISLEILSRAINAEYTMDEKNITLNGEGCENPQ